MSVPLSLYSRNYAECDDFLGGLGDDPRTCNLVLYKDRTSLNFVGLPPTKMKECRLKIDGCFR